MIVNLKALKELIEENTNLKVPLNNVILILVLIGYLIL